MSSPASTKIDKLIRVASAKEVRATAITRDWAAQSLRLDQLQHEVRIQQQVVETLEDRMVALHDALWPEAK